MTSYIASMYRICHIIVGNQSNKQESKHLHKNLQAPTNFKSSNPNIK